VFCSVFSQNAVILPFLRFYNNFSFSININVVILTQKYLLLLLVGLLLQKSVCFVTQLLTGSICDRYVVVEICNFNAPQRQNFTNKNFAQCLHTEYGRRC